jgi:hypothetical protein
LPNFSDNKDMINSLLAKATLPNLLLSSLTLTVFSLGLPLKTLASPFVSQGPFVIPEAGNRIPTPRQVPGKEFTDNFDRDALGNLDSLQNIAWDGAGGTGDSFDYDGADEFIFDLQVDAQANLADTLFFEVIANQSALLFSVETDPDIYYESIVGFANGGLWADDETDIDNMNTVFDLDSLEVWGLDGPSLDDADRFSLLGDPDFMGMGKVSVFAYDSVNEVATPYVSTAELAAAIGVPEALFDLDGLMTFDLDEDADFENGDTLLFSVQPIASEGIDGGEIWVYEKGVGASFLFHGGHLWNTAFDVSGTFGLASENIDALESVSIADVPPVPEPSSLVGLGILGGLGLLSQRKRHKR